MSGRLSPPDIAVVLVYVLGTTALGTWFARRQKSLRTYLVGDRDVAWWLILISIVTTETSAVTFLSVPGLSYAAGGNMTFLQLAFGYVVGRILIAWLLLPMYLRGELFSAYEVLRQRFGPSVQRTASALFLLTRTVADGLRLYLAGLLLHSSTGWDIEPSVLVMAGVTLAYTFFGGMKAVIWTDVIQFILKVGGGAVALAVILAQLPDGGRTFAAVGGGAGKFTVLNFAADWTQPYTFWAGLVGGAFFTMASHGADQMMVQRYLCSRSVGQARAALVLSGFVVLAQFALFLLVGVGLFVRVQTGQMTPPPGTIRDEVFGYFIVHGLPVGLVGLVIAAVLAAAMSTLSGSLNSSASAAVSDFYKPLRPGRDEGHYLRVARGLTVFWGVAQVGVGLVAARLSEDSSVVNKVLAVAGFTTGMVLGLFVLGRFRRPVAPWAALTGLVVGLLAVLAVWLPRQFDRPGLAWPWYAPIGTGVTVAVALAAQTLGKRHAGSPTDRGEKSVLDGPG
jgi:SSS family transporter